MCCARSSACLFLDSPLNWVGVSPSVAAAVVYKGNLQSLSGGDVDGGDDLRHHVAGCDEVDVVAALGLQGEHHLRQFLRLHFSTGSLLADLPVLAEEAAQAAPGEEDGARAPGAAEWVLLAVVRPIAVDQGPYTGAADRSPDRLEAVHMAVTGAEVAIGHVLIGLFGTRLQLVVLQQGEVGGLKGVVIHSDRAPGVLTPLSAQRYSPAAIHVPPAAASRPGAAVS